MYGTVTVGLFELFVLIGHMDRRRLFCSSKDLFESLNNPTVFCSLQGSAARNSYLLFAEDSHIYLPGIRQPGGTVCDIRPFITNMVDLTQQLIGNCTLPDNRLLHSIFPATVYSLQSIHVYSLGNYSVRSQ